MFDLQPHHLFDLSSIIGSVFLLYAYYMISSNKWNADTKKFYVTNFIGAVLALIGVYYRFNFSVLIMEIVFGYLSISGFIRVTRKEKLTV